MRERAGSALANGSIFITNDAAGNFGSAARNTIALLARQRESIVVAAILHHDDCLAARAGMRHELAASANALRTELEKAGYQTPVLTGNILSATSSVIWTDLPPKNLEVLQFRMPSMYGR